MSFLIDHAHLEVGKTSAYRAELAGEVLCGKTRAFGHSVAFANGDAEALLEGSPDRDWTAAAPGHADPVIAIIGSGLGLQQQCQHAAQEMQMRDAMLPDVGPEARHAEAFDH